MPRIAPTNDQDRRQREQREKHVVVHHPTVRSALQERVCGAKSLFYLCSLILIVNGRSSLEGHSALSRIALP